MLHGLRAGPMSCGDGGWRGRACFGGSEDLLRAHSFMAGVGVEVFPATAAGRWLQVGSMRAAGTNACAMHVRTQARAQGPISPPPAPSPPPCPACHARTTTPRPPSPPRAAPLRPQVSDCLSAFARASETWQTVAAESMKLCTDTCACTDPAAPWARAGQLAAARIMALGFESGLWDPLGTVSIARKALDSITDMPGMG